MVSKGGGLGRGPDPDSRAPAQVVEAEALDFDETNTVDPLDRLAFLNSIVDVKEFDVKYHVRVAIDLEIRVGLWYRVKAEHGNITFTGGEDLINPVPKICAFDIECSKAPLKFPDAQVPQPGDRQGGMRRVAGGTPTPGPPLGEAGLGWRSAMPAVSGGAPSAVRCPRWARGPQ